MTQARSGKWLADAESAVAPGVRVVIAAVSASVLIAALGGVLAWRSYSDRVDRENERVLGVALEASSAGWQYLAGKLAVLEALAGAPGVAEGDVEQIRLLVDAAGSEHGGFSGGVGWANWAGLLQASSSLSPADLPLDLSDRPYFRNVMLTGRPAVGEVVTGRLHEEMVVVLAQPIFAGDDIRGVMLGLIVVGGIHREVPALSPAGWEVRVVDTMGRVFLTDGQAGFESPDNPEVLAGPRLTVGPGLQGSPNRVVGMATMEGTGWTVVAERDRAAILSPARGRFVGELGALLLLGSGIVVVAATAAVRINASHRQMLEAVTKLEALEALGEMLSTAPTPEDISGSVLGMFREVFDADSLTVGLVDHGGRMRLHTIADLESDSWSSDGGVVGGESSILTEAYETGEMMVLSAAELESRGLAPGAGVTGAMAGLFIGRSARGALVLFVRGPFPPKEADVQLFTGMVPLLGEAFGRAVAAQSERLASTTLQAALLPRDTIDRGTRLQRAVRYIPAVGDTDVGGDWCDLWMIDSGQVGAVVGDVVGHGVVAAAAMGQLRSALRATAASVDSPADALAQLDELTGQISGSPSATVIFASYDVETRVLRLASAGHLPPVLATRDRVRVMLEARGTPIGFLSEPTRRATVVSELGPEDTLVLYSDGLVERRGESIDEGIGRVQEVVTANRGLGVEALADAILQACLEPDSRDDVALIILRPVEANPATFTRVAPADEFASVIVEVGEWISANGGGQTVVDGVLTRLESALQVVDSSIADNPGGDLVVEVASLGHDTVRVTLEYRRGRVGPETEPIYLAVLRGWGFGEMALGGPRLEFSVGGPQDG